MLQEKIVYCRLARQKLFIQSETLVCKIGLSDERHHSCKYATPFFTAQVDIFLLATHERSCVNAVIAAKPHCGKGIFKT